MPDRTPPLLTVDTIVKGAPTVHFEMDELPDGGLSVGVILGPNVVQAFNGDMLMKLLSGLNQGIANARVTIRKDYGADTPPPGPGSDGATAQPADAVSSASTAPAASTAGSAETSVTSETVATNTVEPGLATPQA